MAGQVPLVDYLVLGDDPHLGPRVHGVRRPVLRPAQRLRLRASARSSARVDRHRGRGAAFTIVSIGARHPGAVRRRGRRLRRHQRPGQRRRRRARPRPRPLGMKVELTTFSIGADDAGTEAVGFGFEPLEPTRQMEEDTEDASGSSGST